MYAVLAVKPLKDSLIDAGGLFTVTDVVTWLVDTSIISIKYTAVVPNVLVNPTTTLVVDIDVGAIFNGQGTKPLIWELWLDSHVSTPSVTLKSTSTLKSCWVFNEPVEKLYPDELFCNEDTEITVLNEAPNASVNLILLNPDESLNVFGIVDPVKSKFTEVIVPFPEVDVEVAYANVTAEHPLAQQFVCMLPTAAYKSSITTHAFCNDWANVVGVVFHPDILLYVALELFLVDDALVIELCPIAKFIWATVPVPPTNVQYALSNAWTTIDTFVNWPILLTQVGIICTSVTAPEQGSTHASNTSNLLL